DWQHSLEQKWARLHFGELKVETRGELNAQPALRVGNPYEEIVSAAKEMGADLIVIGSHGHGGLGRLLLGSTAERVLQYAPCAVLVVKDATVDGIAGREIGEVRED